DRERRDQHDAGQGIVPGHAWIVVRRSKTPGQSNATVWLRSLHFPLSRIRQTDMGGQPIGDSVAEVHTSASLVLIVDDEKDLRQLLDCNLRQAGYRTVHAANGTEALARARGHAPDLILLDLNLPDLPGTEVCRRLKADPATEAIPIVMLTARG